MCAKDLHAPAPPGWAVLLYMAGTCELEPFMAERLLALENVRLSEVDVLIQLGRAPQGLVHALTGREATGIDGDWAGVRRYRLKSRSSGDAGEGRQLSSECVADLGDVNLADPNALYDFLQWGLSETAAAHTMVVLAGHGSGLFGALTDLVSGAPMIMGIRGTCQALSRAQADAGRKIDILLYDTCFMNLVEATYEMATTLPSAASSLLVPVDSSPQSGLPYEEMLRLLDGWTATANQEPLLPENPMPVAIGVAEILNDALTAEGFPSQLACINLEPGLFALVAQEAQRLAGHLADVAPGARFGYAVRLAHLHGLMTSTDSDDEVGHAIAASFRARLSQTVALAPRGLSRETLYKCYSMYLPVPGARVEADCAATYQELAFAKDTGLDRIIAPEERFPRTTDLPASPGSPRDMDGPALVPARIFAPSQLAATSPTPEKG